MSKTAIFVCDCQIERKGCSFPGAIYKDIDMAYWPEDCAGVDYSWRDVKVSVEAKTYQTLPPRLKKIVEVKP